MTSRMFETPGAVKTLRAYWKDKIALPDPVKLAEELHGESDRALVILVATILDDALTGLLTERLVFRPDKKQSDHIFRYEGPLGSFSARTEIAYLFGFIDEITFGQLNDIREMRNACAHSKQPLSFETPELANVARRTLKSGILPLPTETRADIRLSFTTEFIVLFQILIHGSREKGIAEIKPHLLAAIAAHAPSPDKRHEP